MAFIGTLMTPRIDVKIRSRLFAHKLRNKHPDFKDILRERFRSKIRENRRTLFQHMRTLNNSKSDVQNTLCDYLQEEIDVFSESSKPNCDFHATTFDDNADWFDIEKDLEIMKQIESELLEEQLNWIMEEYCKEEEALLNGVVDEPFLCPVCQCGYLQKMDSQNIITCTRCSVHLCTSLTLIELNSVLHEALVEHSSRCNSTPQFTVINEPNSSGLFIICQNCSSFNALC